MWKQIHLPMKILLVFALTHILVHSQFSPPKGLPGFTLISPGQNHCINQDTHYVQAETLLECAAACKYKGNFVDSCFYFTWNGAQCLLYNDCVLETYVTDASKIFQSNVFCQHVDTPVGNSFLTISPSSRFFEDNIHLYLTIPEPFETQSFTFINGTHDCLSWYRDNSIVKLCQELHQWWHVSKIACTEDYHLQMAIHSIYNLEHGRNYVGWEIYEHDGQQYLYSQLKGVFTQQVKYKDGYVDRYIEIWMPWYIILPNVVEIDVTFMVLTYEPSKTPSIAPTLYFPPSRIPSTFPTGTPIQPSIAPSVPGYIHPSITPSTTPSASPTVISGTTAAPSHVGDTRTPSLSPTKTPTRSPSHVGETRTPSLSPTKKPTRSPSHVGETRTPSLSPTKTPTRSPSHVGETRSPSLSPTKTPTRRPTYPGQIVRTWRPTFAPTVSPTARGQTGNPSVAPTFQPTDHPTHPGDTPHPTFLPTTCNPSIAPTQVCVKPDDPCNDHYPCSTNDVCDKALICHGDFPGFSIESVVVFYKLKETHANSTNSRMKLKFMTTTPFPWKLVDNHDQSVQVTAAADIDLKGWGIEQNCHVQNCSACDQRVMVDFITNKVCDIPKSYYLKLIGYNTVSAETRAFELPVDIVQSGVCGQVLTGLTVAAEAYLKTDSTYQVDLTSPIYHVGSTVYIETTLISEATITVSTTFQYAIETMGQTYIVIGDGADEIFKNAIAFTDLNYNGKYVRNSFLLDRNYFVAPPTGLIVTVHSSIYVTYGVGRRYLKAHVAQKINLPAIPGMTDKANKCVTQLEVNILPFVCRNPYSIEGVPPGSYFPVKCTETENQQNLMYCGEYGWEHEKSFVNCKESIIDNYHVPSKLDTEVVTGCPASRQCSAEPSIILTTAYNHVQSAYVRCCAHGQECSKKNGRHTCHDSDGAAKGVGSEVNEVNKTTFILIACIIVLVLVFSGTLIYYFCKYRREQQLENLELDQQYLLTGSRSVRSQSIDLFE